LLVPAALQRLNRDGWLLFLTRFIRLFAYGSLSVVLVFYLVGIGLSEPQTGLLLTLTLVGDTIVSLFLTTRADRIGRRHMLIVGSLLMVAAGLVFASTRNLWLLVLAGTVGVISPSGHEVGPFLSIEQAALSHVVADRIRTEVFAWYTLAGSLATALGALAGGTATRLLQETALAPTDSYRAVVVLYAALGVVLAVLFSRLSRAAEATTFGVKQPAHSGSTDADATAGRLGTARAFQHQPDGRAHEAVLRHACRESGGAIRGGGYRGRRTDGRRRHQSSLCRLHVRSPCADQPAVLHRRHTEDHVRPVAVQGIRDRSTAGGSGTRRGHLTCISPYGNISVWRLIKPMR
jgi:hypothetical protein